MKNHKVMNDQILQTNKRFSHLKGSQKEWIATEFDRLYHEKMIERRTTRKLPPKQRDAVIEALYEAIQRRDIWIPYMDVEKHAYSKIIKAVNAFPKRYPEMYNDFEEEHIQRKREATTNKE
ncbi:hypothetical protein ACQKJC_22645 [Priestia koreensis]|uniref:hypothetical protein n=1 Tax=Priestia koreensis TaxID=284581 RepID=UPI003D0514C0